MAKATTEEITTILIRLSAFMDVAISGCNMQLKSGGASFASEDIVKSEAKKASLEDLFGE